ncbi:hypothetical protein KMT30_06725 [Streptomyces sp. IBSBF 2953]|nr:hypothetical protein [Streptomyces hayashii]
MDIRFSGSRWRQIEKGWRSDSGTSVIALDATLAHMCWALDISSERLGETGRTDAVEILRELERSKAPAPDAPASAAPLAELEEWQQRVILGALDEKPRSPRDKALLLRTLASKIESAQEEEGDAPTRRETPGRSA